MRTCPGCSKELPDDFIEGWCTEDCWHKYIVEFERLEAIRAKRLDAQRIQNLERQKWISASLPQPFLAFDGIPPGVDRKGLEAAQVWYQSMMEGNCDKPNLYIYGKTGLGKTWTINTIIRQAAEDYSPAELEDEAIVLTDGWKFQRAVPKAVMHNRGDQGPDIDQYLKPLQRAAVLAFDELDKIESKRVSMEFFSLLADRVQSDQCTIFAGPVHYVEIAKQLCDISEKGVGPQIARRLRDFFTIIELKK